MSLSVVRTAKKECLYSRDLKDPSESLSLTVLGKAFQVCGAEKRNARLAIEVRTTNGSDSCILVVGRRDRALSCVMIWWLGYVGIDVVRL